MKKARSYLEHFYIKYKKKYSTFLFGEDMQKFIVYLYVILTLITVSFFGLFAIKPTLSTISNLKKQHEDSKLVYEQLRQKLQAIQTLDSLYQQIESDLPVLFLSLPTTTKIPYLTHQIGKMITDNGLDLRALEFGRVEVYPTQKRNQSLYSFTFQMSVIGDSRRINAFLEQLINFDRLVSLDGIATGKTEPGSFGMLVSGRAYFYSPVKN